MVRFRGEGARVQCRDAALRRAPAGGDLIEKEPERDEE